MGWYSVQAAKALTRPHCGPTWAASGLWSDRFIAFDNIVRSGFDAVRIANTYSKIGFGEFTKTDLDHACPR